MKYRKHLFRLCSLLLLICLLPVSVLAADKKPSQAGDRKLEGGKRDFKWPVTGQYHLSSCYLDNRNHYSLDIAAPTGSEIVASYEGTVIDIFRGCEHNWGKKSACCSSWGNYVLLEHSYTLKDGKRITLYSRYAHMHKISVKVGDRVFRGQRLGTVGSTGYSTGPHLDYDILYGGTSKKYSVDPYINDLLELPSGVYTQFGQCCREYVAYVKKYYATCAHPGYNSKGLCTLCGDKFNWNATKDASAMGFYTVKADTLGVSTPYAQSEGAELKAGQQVSVDATVVNGLGESWYVLALAEGKTAYVPRSALEFKSYYPSQIKLSNCTVTEGMTLPKASYRLDGQVTSQYPLRKVVGYLDGKKYATWTGDGNDTQISLRGTSLNKKLNFASLASGTHTLAIFVTDSTNAEPYQVSSVAFSIEKTAVTYKITFQGLEDSDITVPEGKPLGELPVLEQEGQEFLGWFREDGTAVLEETVPEEDMVLLAKWRPMIYTVTLDGVPMEIPHGESIGTDVVPVKEGYDFCGWIAEDGREISVTSQVFRSMTLQTRWMPRSYTLQWDTVGGQMELSTPMSVAYGAAYGQLPVPKREGYLFQGWELDGHIVEEGDIFCHADHVTLTAVWERDPAVVWTWIFVILTVLGIGGAGVLLWMGKMKIPTFSR